MVSSKINIKPRIKLRRSIVSLQKVVPSLNTSVERRIFPLQKVAPSLNTSVERRILPSKKLSSFSDASIEKRIATLEMNVALLAKSINKEADLEKKQQRENEKNLKKQEENKLRSGEEKQLEKKLSKSVLSPVKKMGSKAGGIFEKLKSFFMLLLGGWLTNQGLDTFIALANGDNDKLESIKNEVIKTLAIVGGIFLALNVGILGIVGTIGKIALAIALAPFKFAFRKLGELLKPKPKPKTPNAKPSGGSKGGSKGDAKPTGGQKPGAGQRPGAGGGRAGSGVEGAGNRGTGRNFGPGGTKPLSPGSASRFSESNLKAFQGKANLGDKLRLFYRGGYKDLLKSFMGSGPVKGIKSLLRFVTKGPAAKAIGFIAKPFIEVVKYIAGLLNPRNLKKIGDSLGKAKVLSRLIGPLFAVVDIQSRSSSGMSPAQAIIPALLKALMTSGGAVLGGALPIPGLNILTSFAGGYAGSELGNMLMGGIDSVWDKSWDENFFAGFNNAVLNIGKNDPTGLVSKVFPYAGNEKEYGSNQAPKVEAPKANTSTGTDSNPALVKPGAANVTSSASSMPSAPNPVTGGGNTTVIYKKIGGSGGQQMQGQPLKTGSATDVPLIASENPSNFYTMYSQILYNVVI